MAAPVIDWLRQDQLLVKREYFLPWGICDLVGISLNSTRVRLRKSYGQTSSIGAPERIYLLSKIPDSHARRFITLKRLEAELRDIFSPEALHSELHVLTKSKFIHSPKRGHFQSLNGWAPLHCRIVAVELKLSRTRQAFLQACSNRAFATESYVALPAPAALRLMHRTNGDLFKVHGIGLLAVGHRSCEVLMASNVQTIHNDSILQAHCVERFWRSI